MKFFFEILELLESSACSCSVAKDFVVLLQAAEMGHATPAASWRLVGQSIYQLPLRQPQQQ